ncbi:hypothetical protein T01_4879 [Trichinella spiralis]|uniref:Uncharacterized protein n=3 Tax=Trichinella TaxID=6333 RepID=A0A0V1BIN8_TRISP|nr:hypothetical protein T01_4879 [Trichinella spiralis]
MNIMHENMLENLHENYGKQVRQLHVQKAQYSQHVWLSQFFCYCVFCPITKNMKKPRTSVTKCMTLRLLYTSFLTGLLTVFLNGN